MRQSGPGHLVIAVAVTASAVGPIVQVPAAVDALLGGEKASYVPALTAAAGGNPSLGKHFPGNHWFDWWFGACSGLFASEQGAGPPFDQEIFPAELPWHRPLDLAWHVCGPRASPTGRGMHQPQGGSFWPKK